MEKIQSHDIQDIWRVRYGLLVVIDKYEHTSNKYWYQDMKTKVVKGCKGLKELKEDFEELPKGTLIFGNGPVQPIKDSSKFRYAVKSSGGEIAGSHSEVMAIMDDIKAIIAKY